MNDWSILHWDKSALAFLAWENNHNVLCWCRCSSLLFWNMDFFKLHSQMNPHVRAGSDSNIRKSICLRKRRTKDGWCGDWSIKKVAFSVKTACTLFIVLWWAVLWDCRAAVLFRCRCQQCVWGLDLRQTGRQSLSSQQPTSLSATLAVTKSIMFSLLGHFRHHGGFVDPSFLPWFFFLFVPSFAARLELSGVFMSGQHAKKRGKVYLF